MKTIVTFLLSLIVFNSASLNAQELNCQVSVITDARLEVTTVEKEIFEQLKLSVFEFMNNTQWTKDKFTVEERINCAIQIQIREVPSSGVYKGSLQVQSSRTAFNSSYNTMVFNFQDDDMVFGYSRNVNMNYTPNQYRDELTSMLAFYAYFIIGMDYDTYSEKGGTKYFTEAQQIVTNAQSSGGTAWSSSAKGKNNRYWLVDNAMHELFSPLRECMYLYHRKGVDMLYDDLGGGRKAIYDALNRLVKVTATRPNSINVLNFLQAKSSELKNLYAEAEIKEKNEIVSLLKRIDPANSSKYQEILN